MNQRYESKWAISWKALLYDLMAGFRGALFDVEQLQKEWLRLVSRQFRTSQLYLFNASSQEKLDWTREQKEALSQAFTQPYLFCKEEIDGWPLPAAYNVGFRLTGFCKEKNTYLFLRADKEVMAVLTEEDLLFFTEESSRLIEWANYVHVMEGRVNRYKELFNVTGRLHSSTDIEFVLKEIITTLQKIFPLCSYHFLMAMEGSYTGLPVTHFNFDEVSEAGMASYTNGTIQVDDISKILYAPLIGKQGVYGVLKVNFSEEKNIPETKKEFIRMLANAGGGAIEKVMLYDQSRQLNSDLQLINDASHELNSSLRFSDVTNFLHSQIIRSFNACAVGFIFFNGKETETLPGSSSFFYEMEGKELIHFTAEKLIKDKEAFFIGELANKLERDCLTFHAMMAVPMEQGNELRGFCIVLKKEPYSFTFEMYKLLQSLIHHSTLALANAMLREKLEEMVITDHLTHLYSRNYLDQLLQKSVEKDEKGVFLLMDIDNFKKVNDTYGHQTGDEILIQVAQILKTAIRQEDVAARWGGEELAVYLPNCSLEEGTMTAKRIISEVAENTKPAVTISCGLSCWSKANPPSKKQLFNYADTALYKAKEAGKNRVAIGYCCL
ncbi:diguanylate cyclase [Bacillus sp. PK3_68]|uniref:sensor domain-containing diguanylate cyclase n=1 Tax=Bacillus sp. PK3_68 TaxID=2027408 RepID=UPI00160287AF|nr:diguanylate cyclase [Bacillus sp. PK3_68]